VYVLFLLFCVQLWCGFPLVSCHNSSPAARSKFPACLNSETREIQESDNEKKTNQKTEKQDNHAGVGGLLDVSSE
jgi:hypothetical protein